MVSENKDYILTLFEVCEKLNKSSRTVSRYIRKNILHPKAIKSRQGTLEYRFSLKEIEDFKTEQDKLRQLDYIDYSSSENEETQTETNLAVENETACEERPDKEEEAEIKELEESLDERQEDTKNRDETEQTNHIETDKTSPDKEIITLLKETTEILRDQLKVKDGQISSLNSKIDQLIERDRETNILLKGLQDKVYRLEQPKNEDNLRGQGEAPAGSPASKKAEPADFVEKPKTRNAKAERKKETARARSAKEDAKEEKENPKLQNLQKQKKEEKKKSFFSKLFG